MDSLDGLPRECAGMLASQLGIIRTSTQIDTVEYNPTLDIMAVSVAVAVNKGILSRADLIKVPETQNLNIDGTNLDFFSYTLNQRRTNMLVCQNGNMRHPDRVLCGVVVGETPVGIFSTVAPAPTVTLQKTNDMIICTCQMK